MNDWFKRMLANLPAEETLMLFMNDDDEHMNTAGMHLSQRQCEALVGMLHTYVRMYIYVIYHNGEEVAFS